MRIFNKVKPLRFLLVLCAINLLLNFLLEPAAGASDTMWNEYYQEDKIDMVFVGSSVCSATFNPVVFNEKLGVCSFNMGTPSQAIGQSLDALEVAFREHEIKRVVLGLGFFSLLEAPSDAAEMTFEKAYARRQGGVKKIIENAEYIISENVINKEKSINYFFPWLYNHVAISWNAIYENVLAKVNPDPVTFDADSIERKNWRLEKGYRPYTGELEYEKLWSLNSYYLYHFKKYNTDTIAELKGIIELCNTNEAELLIINTPHPVFDVITCFEYYSDMEKQLSQLCAEYGVEYYNFSLANPEIFDAGSAYFYDFEHLNYKGSLAFSEALCDFIERKDSGENMEQYFYTVEEFYEIHEATLEKWKAAYEPK